MIHAPIVFISDRQFYCFVARGHFVAVDEGWAIDDPDGLEQVHPELEEESQSSLRDLRVIGAQPDQNLSKSDQSMKNLYRTVNWQPTIELSDAWDWPWEPKDPQKCSHG